MNVHEYVYRMSLLLLVTVVAYHAVSPPPAQARVIVIFLFLVGFAAITSAFKFPKEK